MSHRLLLAKGAAENGYHVTVASPTGPEVKNIIQMGFAHYNLAMGRKSMGPLGELITLYRFLKCIQILSPDVIHLFTIKPVLYGALVSRMLNVRKIVVTITGLGFIFLKPGWYGKILKIFIGFLYSVTIKTKKLSVIFQNQDDLNLFTRNNWIYSSQACVILGTGVDTELFSPKPIINNDSGAVKILFPARFLKDKGLLELTAACQNLNKKNLNFILILCGELDIGNPSSLTIEELKYIETLPFIRNYGYCADMYKIYPQTDIVCLPSYREGLPLSLIEASSCGRPIVTTDVPGCREVVVDKLNGFCVPVKNVEALENALSALILDKELRIAMGAKSRERALAFFSKENIIKKNLEVYTENNNTVRRETL